MPETKWISRPRPTIFMSLLNRYAYGHVTRPVLCEFSGKIPQTKRDFVPACTIEMHMDMSPEPFFARIFKKKTTKGWSTLMKHGPYITPTVRTLWMGHTVCVKINPYEICCWFSPKATWTQVKPMPVAALNRLRIAVLNAKLHPKQCPGLLLLQEEHLKLFKTCYTAQRCRLKHHYAMHIERQVATFHMLMDTWPTERKHKVFKSDLAPRIKRLDRFERSIMTRWVEHDLHTLARRDIGIEIWQRCIQQGLYSAYNNVLMFKNGDVWQAFLVVTCFNSKEGLDVIGQQLQLMEFDPHMSWSKWLLTEEYAPFSFCRGEQNAQNIIFVKGR